MARQYQKKIINNKAVYLKISDRDIKNINTIIFDCDGVLINSKNSYDKCIELTISYILRKMLNKQFIKFKISKSTLELFRQTGGFNNDYKFCYVIILKIISMIPSSISLEYRQEYNDINTKNISDSFRKLDSIKLNRVAKKNTKIGFTKELNVLARDIKKFDLDSIEKLITKGLDEEQRNLINSSKQLLNFRNDRKNNIITNVFDEFFYGKNLIKKARRTKKINFNQKGTIEGEKLIVKESSLISLKSRFNKNMSIVSGRGKIGTRFSLGKLFKFFNIKGNVFIEDLARIPRYGAKIDKPNPVTLRKSSSNLSRKGNILYVGDSMEDLLMTKAADKSKNRKYIFAGIYGSSRSERNKIMLFKDNKADIIISNINDIPELFSE
tara:strand:- start:247 stop:1392 length:1146 start_codon:yes stop_codon:yes gene_type:complete